MTQIRFCGDGTTQNMWASNVSAKTNQQHLDTLYTIDRSAPNMQEKVFGKNRGIVNLLPEETHVLVPRTIGLGSNILPDTLSRVP